MTLAFFKRKLSTATLVGGRTVNRASFSDLSPETFSVIKPLYAQIDQPPRAYSVLALVFSMISFLTMIIFVFVII